MISKKLSNYPSKKKLFVLCCSALFPLLGSCAIFSGREIPADPTEISSAEKRDNGLKGRSQLLANSIFSNHSPEPDAQALGDELAKIPINPVCLASNGKPEFLAQNMSTMMLMLYPSDGRSWSNPIEIKNIDSLSSKSFIADRGLSVDLSSVPDGRYHVLMCADKKSCFLDSVLGKDGVSDHLAAQPFKNKTSKYQYQSAEGIFSVDGYRDFLKQILVAESGIYGIASNVWIEQGLIVWPESKISYWNGRAYSQASSEVLNKDYFVDQKSSAPILHLLYGSPVAGLTEGFCFQEFMPVVVDLNNTGVLFSSAEKGVDLGALPSEGGVKNLTTAWPQSSSIGLLAVDLNKNGKIDNHTEIVSNLMTDAKNPLGDGIEALLKLDTNKDGEFDDDDAAFESSFLWVDTNNDGKIDDQEVKKLKDSDIESIDLKIAPILESDVHGNSSFYRTVAERKSNDQLLMVYSIRLQSIK